MAFPLRRCLLPVVLRYRRRPRVVLVAVRRGPTVVVNAVVASSGFVLGGGGDVELAV